MKYIAILSVDHIQQGTKGEGASEAEAIKNLFGELRQAVDILIEVCEGIVLPPKTAATIPKELPDGYGLFALVRGSHNCGESYDWRVFAIKIGTHTLRRSFGGRPAATVTEIKVPGRYSFLDCNADYKFLLPSGSMECVEGAWVSRESAEYDY